MDNLKAAVIKADWFDPDLNPKLADFCRHYGTIVLPTKPRTPRHKGRFSTSPDHLHENKISGLEKGIAYLLGRIRSIGPHCHQWAQAVVNARGIQGHRVVQGLLALTRKHSSEELKKACETAVLNQCYRLRSLRQLIGHQVDRQQPLEFLSEHEIIRPLEDYAAVVSQAIHRQESRPSMGEGFESYHAGMAAACKDHRKLERRTTLACFRDLKPLDQFDWDFNMSIPRSQVFDLATCRFLDEPRDVLLVGPPGTGKTHIAQAIGYAAVKQGRSVLYRSIFDVVRDFLHEEAIDEDHKALARYLKPDLLIIDDMGMKQLPKRSGEYFFEIIMRRHQIKSTLMTSNRPLEDWGKLIGDVPSASAILDRFLETAEILNLQGRSYRLRNRRHAEETASKPAKVPTGKPRAKPTGTSPVTATN